ncbi:hypothetical protein L1889_11295 [Paenalcaligenes niemegkensis]|uniref:hypothetical protein n=1 Tax=Paenalcaligenes niemegkensis TaxID=2895469 RepID=UPI001EE8D9B3|nr:hypothetical protein [Paenalcaligenes niemegkensis]MCQ9617206.1 hypothetical protein [Paenalcaligenes niemegkensis]
MNFVLLALALISLFFLFVFVEIDFSSKTSLLIAAGTFTAAVISLYIANSNWERESRRERVTEEKKEYYF